MTPNKNKFQEALDGLKDCYQVSENLMYFGLYIIIVDGLTIAAEVHSLVKQIAISDYRDQHGHPLINNAAYKRLAEIVGK